MEASLKFRENDNPIIKAKLPINILGIPLRSGIETTPTSSYDKDKDLCLSFSTFFQSGPVLKMFYRPNDSNRPFGLVLKTGVGSFGSPIGAPMTISAEFNFLGTERNPSFLLHFKPQFGDFSIRRSVNSKKIENDCDLPDENEFKKSGKFRWDDLFTTEKAVEGLTGGEVCATTVIPIVKDKVVANIRWSLKFQATESGWKMPYMVVNKMGIQHVVKDKAGIVNRNSRGSGGDVAEGCLTMKKELGNLELEKDSLWKEMEELKSELSAGKFAPAASSRKAGRLRRIIEGLKCRKARKSGVVVKNGSVNGNHAHTNEPM